MVQARASVDDGAVPGHVDSLSNSGTAQSTSAETLKTVEGAFEILKSKPKCKKSTLVADHQVQTSAALLEEAVCEKFRTGCQFGKTIGGSCNLLQWHDEETLEEFMNRVYKHAPEDNSSRRESDSSRPINISDVRAKVLAKHARIDIQPTEKLSDHLYLHYGRGFKILHVYADRSYLEDSLSVLQSADPSSKFTTQEALEQGCLPQDLLGETLRTLDLLFPRVGDIGSHKFLKAWVHRYGLDKRLRRPLHAPKKKDHEKSSPRRLRDLYRQYPFWAPQLADLLEEVNDPTPVTRWQRYAMRKQSQAHIYGCLVAGLMVAAVSGVLATLLGAVQVWIAYEAWQEDKKNGSNG